MKKIWKLLAVLIAVGTAIGLIILFFQKNSKDISDLNDEDFAEDDLDMDLQPVKDREYVPLKKAEPEKMQESTENQESPEEL